MTLKKFTLILTLSVALLTLTACAAAGDLLSTPTPTLTPTPEIPTPTPIPMAALVNGEGITAEEFTAELARYRAAQEALGNAVTDEHATQVVLDELIAQTLLAQGAAEGGFTLTDADVQARVDALAAEIGGTEALGQWMNAQGYTASSFFLALRRQIAAAWMRDQILAGVPLEVEQAHVQQILVFEQALAETIQAQLAAGSAFADLAATYDPVTRGELGWFPRGYLFQPVVEQAAFALQPGDVSDVLVSDVGYHIITVLARENRPLAPDALLRLQERALSQWVSERRAQSEIILAP